MEPGQAVPGRGDAPVVPATGVEVWTYERTRTRPKALRYQAVLDAGIQRLRDAGLEVRGELATGNSVDEIVRVATSVGPI